MKRFVIIAGSVVVDFGYLTNPLVNWRYKKSNYENFFLKKAALFYNVET